MERDHIEWLLISAYNFLVQDMPERSITLLELVQLVDPDNVHCLKMLACANVQTGRADEAGPLIEAVMGQPISEGERTAMHLLELAVAGQSGSPERLEEARARLRSHLKRTGTGLANGELA